MRANQARFPIAKVARLLGVSPSGYYAWRDRELSPRKQYDAFLKACISNIHHQSRGTYGKRLAFTPNLPPTASGSVASASPG